MKQRYAVVFEQSPNNYSAYVPDLPGCVSTGDTWEEIQDMVREAIVFHIEGMVIGGEPLPIPEMSLKEAEVYHSEALSEYVKKPRAEFGDESPELPPTLGMVEVEVAKELSVAARPLDNTDESQ